MRFGILGPLVGINDDGMMVDVGGRQPRVLLAALVAASGKPVSAGTLVEIIWGDEPPASANGTLQSYISRLRRTLGASGGPLLLYEGDGYRLELDGSEVDVARFDELAAEARAHLDAGRLVEARDSLAAALALWRGPALVDLVDQGAALAQAAELEERRLAVLEERIDVDLALGRHSHLVGELSALVDEHPLREGLRRSSPLLSTAPVGRPTRSERSPTPPARFARSWASSQAGRCVTSSRPSSTRILRSMRAGRCRRAAAPMLKARRSH